MQPRVAVATPDSSLLLHWRWQGAWLSHVGPALGGGGDFTAPEYGWRDLQRLQQTGQSLPLNHGAGRQTAKPLWFGQFMTSAPPSPAPHFPLTRLRDRPGTGMPKSRVRPSKVTGLALKSRDFKNLLDSFPFAFWVLSPGAWRFPGCLHTAPNWELKNLKFSHPQMTPGAGA